MTTGSEFEIHPEELRSVVGNVTGILLNLYSVVQEMTGMSLTGATFAPIGAQVAAADVAMKAEQATTLLSLLRLLKQINDGVNQVVQAYSRHDDHVAASFGGSPGSSSSRYTPIPDWAHSNPNQYANWLSRSSDTGIGMVNVYSATAEPSSVHGRLMPGDVMVVEPGSGGDAQIYVMGSDGRFHNGATAPNGPSTVHIYRPVDDSTVIWS